MAYSMHDLLRFWFGGNKKERSVFKTEREAYDFCRNAYKESGGVTPDLRRAYEQYLMRVEDGCDLDRGTAYPSNRADKVQGVRSRL